MLAKVTEEWQSRPQLRLATTTLLDVIFYLTSLRAQEPASLYELAILFLLDTFIKTGQDETGRMKMFYHLPKVFLMHPGKNPLAFVISLGLMLLHVREVWPLKSIYVFFLSIAAGVSISSNGITRMLALGLVAFIMASYMYIWEVDQLTPAKIKPAKPLSENDGNPEHEKDNAIAEDLITKLKKLKVALIIENERPKLSVMEEETSDLRRGRSVPSESDFRNLFRTKITSNLRIPTPRARTQQ